MPSAPPPLPSGAIPIGAATPPLPEGAVPIESDPSQTPFFQRSTAAMEGLRGGNIKDFAGNLGAAAYELVKPEAQQIGMSALGEGAADAAEAVPWVQVGGAIKGAAGAIPKVASKIGPKVISDVDLVHPLKSLKILSDLWGGIKEIAAGGENGAVNARQLQAIRDQAQTALETVAPAVARRYTGEATAAGAGFKNPGGAPPGRNLPPSVPAPIPASTLKALPGGEFTDPGTEVVMPPAAAAAERVRMGAEDVPPRAGPQQQIPSSAQAPAGLRMTQEPPTPAPQGATLPGPAKYINPAGDYFDSASKDFFSKLEPEESAALSRYADTGSDITNEAMRGQSPPKAQADLLNSAIGKHTFPQDVTLYRGMTPEEATMRNTSDMFKEPGFTSTSGSATQAAQFAPKSKTIAAIEVPAGTAAAPMGDLSKLPDEKEYLLGSGSRFEILGTEQGKVGGSLGGKPYTIVRMRLIPGDAGTLTGSTSTSVPLTEQATAPQTGAAVGASPSTPSGGGTSSQVKVIPFSDAERSAAIAAERETTGRANKSSSLAQQLNDAGIKHEDLSSMPPTQLKSHLSDLTKALGINKNGAISDRSVSETLFELKKLETRNKPQLVGPAITPANLKNNPRALGAAAALAQEMTK